MFTRSEGSPGGLPPVNSDLPHTKGGRVGTVERANARESAITDQLELVLILHPPEGWVGGGKRARSARTKNVGVYLPHDLFAYY